MRQVRPRRLNWGVSLLALLWLMAGGVDGAELCLGAEEHVKLEYLCNTNCQQIPSATVFCTNRPNPVLLGHSQTPCIDILICLHVDSLPFVQTTPIPQRVSFCTDVYMPDRLTPLAGMAKASIDPFSSFYASSHSVLLI